MTNFKTIPDCNHLEISDCGSIVRKVACQTPIAISTNGVGYKIFRPGEGINQPQYVHRAVLAAHARQPNEGEITRHLNDDRADNQINNLAWGTYAENFQDSVRNGRRPRRAKPVGRKPAEGIRSILSAFQDPQIIRDIRTAHLLAGVSQSELARQYGVGQATISSIVRFKSYASIVSEPEVEAFRPVMGNA